MPPTHTPILGMIGTIRNLAQFDLCTVSYAHATFTNEVGTIWMGADVGEADSFLFGRFGVEEGEGWDYGAVWWGWFFVFGGAGGGALGCGLFVVAI